MRSIEHATTADILVLHRHAACVFQNYALYANRTERGNISEALMAVKDMTKAEAQTRADAIL